MKLLSKFSFVKAKTITPEKALIIEKLKEAVYNLNLVKNSKLVAKPAKTLLNEL